MVWYDWCDISEPVPVSVGSEEKLSQSNEDQLNDDNTSCIEVEEGFNVKQQSSEEDLFRMLAKQSSVQKIDAAEAAEKKWLWEEEIKAYYDRWVKKIN